MYLKINFKKVLKSNKELAVENLNKNRMEEKGKKCDFFFFTDIGFNRITEISK